jgi:SRSO17 transposase
LSQIDKALSNGIVVSAWTGDEAYGKDAKFLDGLEKRNQSFVMEIPCSFHGWLSKPKLIVPPSRKTPGRPFKRKRPRKKDASRQVNNLASYSPVFKDQNWQRYRIKDTERGPEVWEVKWALFYRKHAGKHPEKKPSKQHTLIVCRNVRTGEVKYFLSNGVVGRDGATLRWMLRVAFGRWVIETCFRTAKEELGMDHFEVRGWRCIHRHWYVTQLSYLFCSRLRLKWDDDPEVTLTVEQVRSVVNTWLCSVDFQPPDKRRMFEQEIAKQQYHQKRNATARKSHTKTRRRLYQEMGIPIDTIKSCTIHPET